jgi:single-strand DNA-binding protein
MGRASKKKGDFIMNVNNVTLAGRLTKDVELTYIGEKNTAKATMTLAVNRIGQKDKTDFISVEVFGIQAENCEKYLVKGQVVAVTGAIRVDTWKKDDKWNSRTYVVASQVQFGAKPNGGNSGPADAGGEPEPIPF